MSWRSLIISQPARLKVHRNQLVITQASEITIPLEDIAIIIIEAQAVTLTAPLLSELAHYGITLLTCNAQHLPNGQWLPLLPHSRQTKMVYLQVGMTSPLKKRLWQRLIISKIQNQSAHLTGLGQHKVAQQLMGLSKQVTSGDTSNIESQAAALYFPAFCGENFTRRQENRLNALLDYGYSILRGAIARALVSYGFLPVFGLFHHNEQNAFNLADDFIEPWRIWVDLAVSQWFLPQTHLSATLTIEDKQKLVSLLHHQVHIQQEKMALLTGMGKMVASFQKSLIHMDYRYLVTPTLCDLKWHHYE